MRNRLRTTQAEPGLIEKSINPDTLKLFFLQAPRLRKKSGMSCSFCINPSPGYLIKSNKVYLI